MNSWFEFPPKTCRRDNSVFLLPGQGADTYREARVGRHWGLHMEQLFEAVRADQLGPRLLFHRCLRTCLGMELSQTLASAVRMAHCFLALQ